MPLLFGWFVDRLQNERYAILTYLWQYVAVYGGLVLLQWSFHRPARMLERKLAFAISENLLFESFRKVMLLPMDWHDGNHSGSLTNRLKKAYVALRQFFENGFIFFQTIIQTLISAAAILYFSPMFAGVVFVLGAFTIWVNYKFDRSIMKAMREFNEADHSTHSTFADILSNIFTVITLRIQKPMQEEMTSKVRKMFPSYFRLTWIGEWRWLILNILVVISYLSVLGGYVYTNYQPGQPLKLGDMVALMGFVNQFTLTFYAVAQQYTQLTQYHTEIQGIKDIGEMFAKLKLPENANIPQGWTKVQIDNLEFTYADKAVNGPLLPTVRDETVRKLNGLRNVSLTFARGMRIALIGKSGSGKSTLLAILRGIYPPSSLQVSIDGVKVDNLQSIADSSTLLPQEPEVFENSLRYNLTLGLPFDDREIERACHSACFTETMIDLKMGMQSQVSERGGNLSGGQKQRMALCRGLLASQNSDILLLDEPTSSVDAETELEIYTRIFEYAKDKVIICSIHNLNLLPLFDYVYKMVDGCMVAQGVPEMFMIESDSGKYSSSLNK